MTESVKLAEAKCLICDYGFIGKTLQVEHWADDHTIHSGHEVQVIHEKTFSE